MPPVKLSVPDKVRVAVLVEGIAKASVAVPPLAKVPEKAVEVSALPVVNVTLVEVLPLFTVPAPASEPTLTLKPSRKKAPLATLSAGANAKRTSSGSGRHAGLDGAKANGGRTRVRVGAAEHQSARIAAAAYCQIT